MRGGGSVQRGGIYHLISRFVAKEWFIESSVERSTYLSLLAFEMRESDWRCFSYAIMSSHIHLGLVAGATPLVDWLGPMHTAFAKYINERRERIGAIFVKGPDVIAYRPDGVAHLINYIHNNPVRAGVVERARDSDWTSHRAYVGLTCRPPWLDVKGGLEIAGFANGAGLEAWMDEVCVDRAQVDAYRLVPRRPRGRPSKEHEPTGTVQTLKLAA